MLANRYPGNNENIEQDKADQLCRGDGGQVAVHSRMVRGGFFDQSWKVVKSLSL